jgi:hypothetical protein
MNTPPRIFNNTIGYQYSTDSVLTSNGHHSSTPDEVVTKPKKYYDQAEYLRRSQESDIMISKISSNIFSLLHVVNSSDTDSLSSLLLELFQYLKLGWWSSALKILNRIEEEILSTQDSKTPEWTKLIQYIGEVHTELSDSFSTYAD